MELNKRLTHVLEGDYYEAPRLRGHSVNPDYSVTFFAKTSNDCIVLLIAKTSNFTFQNLDFLFFFFLSKRVESVLLLCPHEYFLFTQVLQVL